jgi:hypothetical protein
MKIGDIIIHYTFHLLEDLNMSFKYLKRLRKERLLWYKQDHG